MSDCCNTTPCPSPVSTINIDDNTYTAVAALTVSVGSVSGNSRVLTFTVAQAGYYLLRVWFQDAATPSASETLDPPADAPGVNQLWLVTNALGVATLTVTDPRIGNRWYPMAAVVAPVVAGAVI